MGTFEKSSNLDTNQPILIHLRPQRQFFNQYFICFFQGSGRDGFYCRVTTGWECNVPGYFGRVAGTKFFAGTAFAVSGTI